MALSAQQRTARVHQDCSLGPQFQVKMALTLGRTQWGACQSWFVSWRTRPLIVECTSTQRDSLWLSSFPGSAKEPWVKTFEGCELAVATVSEVNTVGHL